MTGPITLEEMAVRHETHAIRELDAAEIISAVHPDDTDQLNMVSVVLAKAQAHATLAVAFRLAARP